MLKCMLGRYVASTVYLVPNLSEGADDVGRQLRGGKECPFPAPSFKLCQF